MKLGVFDETRWDQTRVGFAEEDLLEFTASDTQGNGADGKGSGGSVRNRRRGEKNVD